MPIAKRKAIGERTAWNSKIKIFKGFKKPSLRNIDKFDDK